MTSSLSSLSKIMPAPGSLTHLQQTLNSDSLVVIDANIVDLAALVSDLSTANANVLLLSAEQDGVSQITDALKAQSHLSSLHIVSHGTPGCLHLGNTQLSLKTLDQHASALSVWADNLADADMLLYGCQVAKGALGHLFLQQLRQLTGANIAAAEKRIGRVGYNTNWNLDTQLGEVKTPLIFSEALQASYPSHFEPVVDFSINTDTVIESEGTPVVFNFSLSEPPPAGGTVIRWEGSIPQAINQLDLFALNVQGLADLPVDVSAAQDFSAFEITIIEQNASISLPGFNDFRDDSPQEITWTISPVSGGTVGNSSATFTIYDDASEVPANPTPPDPEPPTPPAPTEPAVSLSADQTTLVEDEGTEVTLTINLSEPPPEGGVQIEVVTGKPFALGDFDIFPPPPQATTTGGRLVRGLDDNSGFIFNVTEQTATISLPIFDDADRPASDPNSTRNDDIGEEQTTFSIAAGDGYSVSSNSAVTLTLKDTNQVAPPPNPTPDPLTIGLSADPTALVEEDGTATTLTFTLSEAPPEGGIMVTIDSDIPASLAEFNVNAANFSGVQLVGANDDASGFTVLITDQVATIQLPVFDDDLDEGVEEITYSLQAGEGYEIDGAAGSTTLSISDSDAVVTPPANTAPVANNDSYSTAADSPLTVAAGEGVLVGDTDADGDSLVATFVGNPDNGSVEFAEDGSFTYTPNAGFVGTDSFTYQASDGQDSSEVATVTIEVGENTPPPTGGDAPVVSFSVTPGVVSEAEGTNLVMNFAVDGDIPPEGITVKLEGDAARIMQQFTAAQTRFDPDTGEIFYRFDRSLVEDNVVGGELGLFSLVDGNPAEGLSDAAAAGDAFLSDFTFKITAANASITLPVFDDIIEEEDATFTYTLVEGEGYSVDSAANTGTFTVTDGVAGGVGPTVGVTASPVMLVESDQTTATVTFNTVGEIPPEGVVVQLAGMPRAIAEFDVNATNPRLPEAETVIEGVTVAGGSIVGTDNVAGSIFFRITDPTATITVPVFQDDVAEGTENLTFNLLNGEAYEVDAAASEISFSIEDGEGNGNGGGDPSVVTDGDSVSTNNDIIASAQTIDLSADNPLVKVQASISQRFEDRNNTVDGTEDVDMFAVTLKAGDRITIDADSITTNLDGFQVGPAPDLTIFNAAGEKVVVGTDEEGENIFAFSSRDGAPDEAFVAGRDAYLDFTATEDGTYYIGASQYLNNSYDPNVVGSGSGAFFDPRFGVGPGGEYTLDIALNPEGFDGEVYEAFTGTPNAGAPIVSLLTDAGTFTRAENRDDIVVASELIESGEAGRGTLGVSFNVAGDIPEGGLEVLIKNDQGVDLNDYFEGLSGNPRIVVGGTLTGGLYSADGALIGFKALLVANNAFFPFTASANDQDDPNAPETFTFSLANSADYIANEAANSSNVTIYDDLAQVPVNSGPRPEVGLTFDTTEFIESEGTEGTLTFTVNGDIPEGGLQVYVDSEDSLLGEFDVFNAEVSGGGFPSPSGNASGFFFRVFENTATIKLTVFDETTNDQIPAEDALEGIESFSLSIQPLDNYTINASAASVDFTIKDNPDSVVIPDSGEGDGNGEEPTGPIDTDSDDTINDTLDTAVDTGLTADNNTVTIDGDIALRRRNPDEQKADNTEDVDIYSFELAAGQKVNIGADSVPFELNGITQNTAPTLRLFNAAGEELALSATTVENGAVTDVAALEYTADAAGTYYVGVSQYLNDNYDPMVNASGDGVQLIEEGISPGAYQLDLVLSAGDDNGGGGMMPDIVGTDAGEILIGNDEKNIIDALGGDDTVAGGLEDDIISGGDGDDVLRGDRNSRSTQNGQIGGNDIIFGGNGNDRIGGKSGNDILSGDAGDDFIWGDAGDDIIMGVTGNDILVGDNFSGGSGSDLFVFGSGDGTDTILDFEVGTDRIGLVSGELIFADLTITQDGNNTLLGISSSNETIAVLNNVQASALTASSFAVVSDVSNPEEALQLI